jgi:hypothetical protein
MVNVEREAQSERNGRMNRRERERERGIRDIRERERRVEEVPGTP